MKTLKRIAFTLFLLLIATVVFRSWLYNHMVSYKSIAARNAYSLTDKSLISELEKEIPGSPTPEQLIEQALAFTANQLTYSTHQQSANPNKLYYSHNAHCVGYAAYYAACCNHLFVKHNYKDWRAAPVAGQLYLLGVNVHPYFHSPFFKDHDFVLLTNTKTGQTIAVDPSLYDYTFIKKVSIKP